MDLNSLLSFILSRYSGGLPMNSTGINQSGASSSDQSTTPSAQTTPSTSGLLGFDEYFKQNPINMTQEIRTPIEFEGKMRDPQEVQAYERYRNNFNNPQRHSSVSEDDFGYGRGGRHFGMGMRPMMGGMYGGMYPGMMGGGYGMGLGYGGYLSPMFGGYNGYGGYGGFGGYQNPMMGMGLGAFSPASNYYGNAPGPQTPSNPYPLMQSQTYTPYQQQFQQNNNTNSSSTAPALGTGSLSSLGGLGAYAAQ